MLLGRHFDDPQVNVALELFLRILVDELGESLLSVLLYGSILFDDLAPGYGDLDFLAVLSDDLDADTSSRLVEARRPLRSGYYGPYCPMIEGAFLPLHMLNPASRGTALWWGTSGEREWPENRLGPFVLSTIRERGLTIWGRDIRDRIPAIRRQEILEQLLAGCRDTRTHAKPTSLQCLDFLFTPARELLWLREGRLSSKSEAADWGYLNAAGEWRKQLPHAKFLRKNPQAAGSRDVQRWLEGLEPAIIEAVDELESALAAAMEEEGRAIAST